MPLCFFLLLLVTVVATRATVLGACVKNTSLSDLKHTQFKSVRKIVLKSERADLFMNDVIVQFCDMFRGRGLNDRVNSLCSSRLSVPSHDPSTLF